MELKMQDWQDSRWENTKKISSWHFDTSRPAKPGRDSYTYVGKFVGDFSKAIEICMPRAKRSTWANRNKHKIPGELWSAGAEEYDLIQAGADPKMEIFSRDPAHDIPEFRIIGDILGLHHAETNFHNQTTGQMLVEHIDNFAGSKARDNKPYIVDFDENPDMVRRFTIMLADWQLGQVFQLGNAMWTQWQAGDCITWEWRDIPHSTCNMGWWDRPMLQITGRTTEQTKEILDNAGPDQVFNIADFM